MTNNRYGLKENTFSMVAMYFILIAFIESLLVYINSSWHATIYFRYAKSMERSLFTNLLFIIGYGGLFFITLLYANKFTQKRDSGQLFIIIILSLFSIVWTVLSIYSFSIANIFGSQTPATVFFFTIFYMLGYIDKFWGKFIKFLYAGGVIYAILSFADAIGFVIEYGFSYKLTSSPALTYLAYSIFMLAIYIAMNSKYNSTDYFIIYTAEFMLLAVGIIALSRSWVIQAGLLILFSVKRFNDISHRKNISFILICTISVIIWFALSNIISTSLSALIERMAQNTRINQITTFFEQVSWKQMMLGQGMGATYSFGNRTDYQYIDNQLILIMFRYSISACLVYVVFFLRPFFKTFSFKEKKYMATVPIIMWMLAVMGLSTYMNISNNILHLCMIIYIGRLCYCHDNETSF